MRASIDQRIRVIERLMQGVTVFADPGQIHQLVVNLVTNAAQAIGDHAGTISVTLDPGPDDASVRLIVADDGDGMDERTLSRMFEPFFTTREVGAGAGLGLAIVHGIVTGHGGSIAAEEFIPATVPTSPSICRHIECRNAAALAIAAA